MWITFILAAIGEKIDHCVGIRVINKSNKSRTIHKIETWIDTSLQTEIQKTRRDLSMIYPNSPKLLHVSHEDKRAQAYTYEQRQQKKMQDET